MAPSFFLARVSVWGGIGCRSDLPHARQLDAVLAEHLGALCERVDLLTGADQRVFVDVDLLLRPVYGHAEQGASYGHTKIAGKQVLRKGLSRW